MPRVRKFGFVSGPKARHWFAFALLVLACCGLVAVAHEAGDPCSANEKCDAHLVCVDGKCDALTDASSDGGPIPFDAAPPLTCDGGETACNGACVNTTTDRHNCGHCDFECRGACGAGRCVETVFDGGARAITAGNGWVYFSGEDGIMQLPVTGGTAFPVAQNPHEVDEDVYWMAIDSRALYVASSRYGSAYTYPLDGSRITPTGELGNSPPLVDPCFIDSTRFCSVSRPFYCSPLDGNYLKQTTFQMNPTAMASNDVHLFVAGRHIDQIDPSPLLFRVEFDAGGMTQIAAIPNGTTFLRVDKSYAYWVEQTDFKKMPVDGGTIEVVQTNIGSVTPNGFILDGDYAYLGSGQRLSLKDGTLDSLVTMENLSWPIAIDSTSLYIATDSNIVRVTPK